MPIQQLSVLAENKPGAIIDITRALGEAGVDIRALSLADTSDYGILRLIVDRTDTARKALEARGEKIDYAINVEVPDENIVHRMGGRRACIGCGATYHVEFNAPKVEDICDTCGGELVLRDDDKPETVQKRLSVYHAQTQPLIDYYKKANVLVEVDGTQDINVVFQDIVKILGA